MQQTSFEVEFIGKKYPAHYVTSIPFAEQCVSTLMEREGVFAVDTETAAKPEYRHIKTAALSPHLGRIRLLQIFDGETSYVFDLFHVPAAVFVELLSTKQWIAHNAMFDLGFFKAIGVKDMNIGCTFIISKLLIHAVYPTDSGAQASLAAMCESILGSKVLKALQVSDWSNVELTYEQVEYAAIDAIAVMLIAQHLAKGMKKYGLERVYQLYKRAQHPLISMQLNGIGIDFNAHKKLIVEWRDALYTAKKEVLKITGLDELTSAKIAAYLETTLPPKLLRDWPRTPTGTRLSTNAGVLAEFGHIPVVKPFLEYQKKEKLSSTYGNALLKYVNPATNKIHTSFKLCGARTGRLSSASPNLQNQPRDGTVRALFVPDEGCTFIRADYSQIEIRVGAELSQDREMLKAYRTGVDIHTLTASIVSRKPIDKVTKEDRQAGKAIVFGNMFGIGASKFSHYASINYGVDVTEDQAAEMIHAFRTLYSGYHDWQMQQARNGAKTKLTTTPMGKLRRLPDDNTFGNSMNTPVQGGASECMLSALCILYDIIRDTRVKLINTVHDEVLVQVPSEHVDDIMAVDAAIKDSMVEGFLEVFPNGITNNIVESNYGKSWQEAK